MGDGGLSRIRYELVNDLVNKYGKGAYTYAVERMDAYEGNAEMVEMWREVFNKIDEHFKQGEVQ